MATAMVGTIALGLLLPEGVRTAFLGVVTAIEVDMSVGNLPTVPGACGLPPNTTR